MTKLDFDLDKTYKLKKSLIVYLGEDVMLEQGYPFKIESYGTDRDEDGYYNYVVCKFEDVGGEELEIVLFGEEHELYI